MGSKRRHVDFHVVGLTQGFARAEGFSQHGRTQTEGAEVERAFKLE